MNCTEIIEYLSAFVDGELEAGWRKEFDTHIARCFSCRTEFELETMTKGIVRRNLVSQEAPLHVRSRILQQIVAEFAKKEGGGGKVRAFVESVLAALRQPAVRPALVIGTVAVLALTVVLLLTRREPSKLPVEAEPSDLVEQAVAHYSSYMNGKMQLQLVSSDRDELRNFFKGKVAFDVYIPKMADAELIGGVLCEHTGGKFVNFIYKIHGKVVYFSLACSEEMKSKGKFFLSSQAQNDLNRSGWHFDTTRSCCNVAVWKENDELCSVVADMKKEDLLVLLKEDEGE